jgi:hypothetical protein
MVRKENGYSLYGLGLGGASGGSAGLHGVFKMGFG